MLRRKWKDALAAAWMGVVAIALFAGCQTDGGKAGTDSGTIRSADGQADIRSVGEHVTASRYGSRWPLNVDAGTIYCWRSDPRLAGSDYDIFGWAVTFTPDGRTTTYKIGGHLDARSRGWEARWALLRTDRRRSRETLELRLLVEDGKRLCSPPLRPTA